MINKIDLIWIAWYGTILDPIIFHGYLDSLDLFWLLACRSVKVLVDDDGPGFSAATDPFVPFFTTKPQGSGIGLALSRQIAEAHGGYLSLTNHSDRPGCRALLKLPIERRPQYTP